MKFAINTPAELTDAELETVYGGWGNDNGSSSAAAAAASASSSDRRIHSFSLVCDISLYSVNLSAVSALNIADCFNQTCINAN